MAGTGVGAGPLGPLLARAHPLRETVINEIHARPPQAVSSPAEILHVILLLEPDDAASERGALNGLCMDQGIEPPPDGVKHAALGLRDGITLVWEKRTEASTFTFYQPGGGRAATLPEVLRVWLGNLPGLLLGASKIILRGRNDMPPSEAMLKDMFPGVALAGAHVSSDHATVWTDFHAGADGIVKILIQDRGLTAGQIGRLVYRLLDIETYRLLLLLALPLAQRVAPRITLLEQQLARLATELVDVDGVSEQVLLRSIAQVAAEVETLAVDTPYRFGAALAYHALVLRRLAEFREDRVPGLQTLGEFLERRLSPAVQTCTTIQGRIEGLSRRATRIGNLLRTRVDVALERQNVELLAAMNKRSHLQLRLQETVEGLSVAAITYYAVGLVGYAAQGLHAAGLPVNKEIATGVAIPVIFIAVWLGLRRFRRSLHKTMEH